MTRLGINFDWDRTGIAASAICMIHYLAVPLLLASLPVTSLAYSFHSLAHPILLIFIVPSVVFSIYSNRKYGKGNVLLILGLGFLFFAWNVHHNTAWLAEILITSVASVLLLGGHGLNYMAQKKHRQKPVLCNLKFGD